LLARIISQLTLFLSGIACHLPHNDLQSSVIIRLLDSE